jgi:adenylate cyclase
LSDTPLVNVIGDAVLLAADTVDHGLASTLALLSACNGEPAFPLARAGIHTGTAVRTGDNYLGAGVNVAARITGRAAGGELVLTSQPAAAARTRGLHVHDLGLVALRNVTLDIELHRVDLDCGQRAVDPVCRMTVAQHEAAGTLTFDGQDYWFCSLACAGTFAADPSRHTVPLASHNGPVGA